ncbi:hypothetical protein ZEAMMB73_Zm00001d014475 [Zea mays]|uniref:Uncharacterized protein n=1 Tax=Zea mays TaxID=4577 RepID=A0A1D6GTM3_MAIZE|nr:hypothetical protein ZEAMMB73_Zm00001d014475 [Zea mays]
MAEGVVAGVAAPVAVARAVAGGAGDPGAGPREWKMCIYAADCSEISLVQVRGSAMN